MDLDSHIVRYTASNQRETVEWQHLETWLIENVTGEVTTMPGPGSDQVDIIFEEEQDAVMWMLRWGGEHLRPKKTEWGGFSW